MENHLVAAELEDKFRRNKNICFHSSMISGGWTTTKLKISSLNFYNDCWNIKVETFDGSLIAPLYNNLGREATFTFDCDGILCGDPLFSDVENEEDIKKLTANIVLAKIAI